MLSVYIIKNKKWQFQYNYIMGGVEMYYINIHS